MGIMTALALLAGGVGGYTRGQEAKREETRQKEDDDYRREQRQRQRIDWQRQDEQYNRDRAEQEAVKKAGAPTAVEEVPQLDLGDPEAAPTVSRFKAAGTMVDTRADADKAAADYNAAPARMRRAAGAVSDPVRAGQLEASAQTAETGAMQLRAAKLKEADDAFNRDLMSSVTDFASLESFVNASKGDGQNGALQIKIVPNPDGKTVAVMKLGADGTMTPTPFSFQNTTEGVQQAAGIIGMRLPPEQKLAHLQAAAKTEEERRRWGLEFGLKEKDSLSRGKREDRMAAAAERQAVAAERTATAATAKAAAANSPGALTLADLKDGHKTIAGTLNADYKTQIENAADDKTAKAIKTAREQEIAAVQRIYTGAMTAGFALTPEQAIVAYRTGETATQTYKTKDGTGTVKMQGILYQGRFIPMAENPGALPGQDDPKPAPPPAAAPAAAPAPAATQAASAPAAPAPGPMTRMTGDKALNAVQDQQMAVLQPMAQQLRDARAQLAAVGKSGDAKAIATYSQQVNAIAAKLRAQAEKSLGNGAEAFLATI